MIFRQLFDKDTSTYTYLLADRIGGHAVIIDPVSEQVERDLNLINELGLTLTHILDTHVHADHITSSGPLREFTSAAVVVPKGSGVALADIYVSEGDVIPFGGYKLKVLETPGHTSSCVSYLLDGTHIFTGDALLIRGSGRTDFQNGSSASLFQSITQKIFTLPEETQIWPGHDYQGRTSSTVWEEKRYNTRLAGKTRAEYTDIMNNLNLALPRKIDVSVPGNLICGIGESLPSQEEKNVTPEWVHNHRKMLIVLDVRTREEFDGVLGHIEGSLLVRGDRLLEDLADVPKERAMVVVCRSGKRSMKATETLRKAGYPNVWNMAGGMIMLGRSNIPVLS